MSSHFLTRLAFHSPFWLLIIGLMGWIFIRQNCRFKKQVLPLVAIVYQDSESALEQQTEVLLAAIEKSAREYPKPGNQLVLERAQMASRMTEQVGLELINWEDRLTETRQIPRGLLHQLTVLADSFNLFTDRDKHFKKYLSLLGSDTSNHMAWNTWFWANARIEDRRLVLQSLRMEALSNLVGFLHYCSEKIGGLTFHMFSELEPMLSAKNGFPLAGEIYEADIFLTSWSNVIIDRKINLNGDPIPVRDGLASFTRRYHQPGEKRLETAVSFCPPGGTNDTVITKTFTFHVLSPCPE